MDSLDGKVAVITGGASGIGLAMARRFAAEGMKLVLADIEQLALDEAVGSFGEGVEVLGMAIDVADYSAVEALRDAAVDAFGTVHVVCNNAGVGSGGLSWEVPLEDWQWVIGVDLWGVIHGIKAFVPLLVEQGVGHVVNTSSMAGVTSPPYMAPYNVSKHGVVTLTETLYSELALVAPGVSATVVCPGWVKTRIDQSSRNRPGGATPAAALMEEAPNNPIATGIDPAAVADLVAEAVLTNQFYVFTHDWMPMIKARHDRIQNGQAPNPAMAPRL